jgi:hypothetical protein
MNDKEYTNALIDFAVDKIMGELDSNKYLDDEGHLITFDDIFSGDNFQDLARGKFNLYPSSNKHASCHELALFISLNGKRWKIKPNNKLSFHAMFECVIKHCQGLCPKNIKTVAIIVDNWDDDVVSFWQANVNLIKSNGVEFELRQITGNRVQRSQL